MARKKGDSDISEKMIRTIIYVKALPGNEDKSGAWVRSYILRHKSDFKLSKERIPGKRTVEKIIADKSEIIREKSIRIRENEGIDNDWSIGSCSKFNIPGEMIPVLIKEQSLRLKTNIGPGKLKIREAIWLARLYPLVTSILPKYFLEDKDKPNLWHTIASFVARQYSSQELMEDIMGEKSVDTKALDYWLFIEEDYGLWKILRDMADEKTKEGRDPRFANPDDIPPKIDSFVTYIEESDNVDIPPIPPVMTIEEQLEKRRQENER